MRKMSKSNVSDFFTSYACDFNEIYGNKNSFPNKIINQYLRRSMKARYAKTIEGCCPIEGKSVIDIGCGPGHYGVKLAQKGAQFVCGIDFAETMIDLARQNAEQHCVADKCHFIKGDFLKYKIENKFDYSIVMGFMDYIKYPKDVIEKVSSITNSKAFFSFPVNSGFLAWQRKIRYKKKCDLFMYNIEQLHGLFRNIICRKIDFDQIYRDFFVTIFIE